MTSGRGNFRAGQDLPSEAERMVNLLRREGCDAIVLLSHCGLDVDRMIARSVAGISAILGGHSHTLMEREEFVEGPGGWVTVIGQAGSYARYLGRMDIVLSEGMADREGTSWRAIPLEKDIPEDPRVALLIEPFRERLKEKLDIPLAPQPEDFDARRETLRTGKPPGEFPCRRLPVEGRSRRGLYRRGQHPGGPDLPGRIGHLRHPHEHDALRRFPVEGVPLRQRPAPGA